MHLLKDRRDIDPLYNLDSYYNDLKQKLQLTNWDAREHLIASKQARVQKFNANLRPTRMFNPGEKVLLKSGSRSKQEPIFNGPYLVVKDENPNLVIRIKNKEHKVHKTRIKPY